MTGLIRLYAVLLLALIVSACGSTRSGGGYYKDDGPLATVPANIAAIPNASPRIERHAPANFRPYEVFGVRYQPIGENQPYRQQGIASWYGKKFHGKKTANGETYDMYAMTAAHPTLPLPSYAIVSRPGTDRSVVVRINDRGPFHTGRIIDLSYVAAYKLGLIGPGSGQVVVQAITNNDIRAGNYPQAGSLLASATPSTSARPSPAASDAVVPKLVASTTLHDHAAASSPDGPARSQALDGSRHKVYLQYGAFASADNANSLASRINDQIQGISKPAVVSQHAEIFKVRSGPFSSRELAHQDAELLSATTGLNPVISLDQSI